MADKTTKDSRPWRIIAGAALPLYLTVSVDRIGILVVVALLGHHGTTTLAAFVLITVPFYPAQATIMGALRGVTPMVATHVDSPREALPILRGARWLALFAGAIGAVPILILPVVAGPLGAPAETVDALSWFPVAMAASLLSITLKQGAVQALIALDRSNDVMWPGLIDIGVTVLISAVAIPLLGLSGGGVALAVGSFSGAAVANWRLRRVHGAIGWGRPQVKGVLDIGKVGIPLAGTSLVRVTVMSAVALAASRIGAQSGAVHGVMLEFVLLITIASVVIGQASIPIMSRSASANELPEIRQLARVSFTLTAIVTAVGSFVVLALWNLLVRLFTDDVAVQDLAFQMLPLLMAGAFVQAVSSIPSMGLLAMRRTSITFTSIIFTFGPLAFIAIPIASTFGLTGLWYAFIVASLAFGALQLTRLLGLTRSGNASSPPAVE